MEYNKNIEKIQRGLKKKNRQIHILNEQISILNKTLDAYKRSLMWKIWHGIDSGINSLLPINTLRRSLYDNAIEKSQQILNDGMGFRKMFRRNNDKPTFVKKPLLTSTTQSLNEYKQTFPKYCDPKVSIVIVTFNNMRFTRQCLDSIKKHTSIPYEIIIVDNNSVDQTKELLKKITGITILYNKKNEGFGKACNMGAKIAKTKYIAFLNNDTIVTPDWLTSLYDTMDNIKDCGAVGGKIIGFNGLLHEAGRIILKNGNCKVLGRGKKPQLYEYSYLREVDHCTAACLLIKKRIFWEVNGFDNRYYPAYYEDVDLSMSIKNRGYKIYYQPKSVIYHNQHASISKKKIIYLTIRNKIRFKQKWKTQLLKLGHEYK